MNIHVSNLGTQVTEASLDAMFSAFGDVQSVTIIMNPLTGKSSGVAYVEMPVEEEAILALKKLNGAVVNGLHLEVKEASLMRTF